MATITLLYPGQMGGAFAALLLAAGHKVISPVGDRSEQTRKAAQAIGIEARGSVAAAVAESDLILSLVPPSAVLDVAARAIAACREQKAAPVFIDLNAKSPADARRLDAAFHAASLPFCNACVIGRATHLAGEGRIYASGPDTAPLEELFAGILPVVRLGGEIVQATVFKMAFAGFNKSVAAALFESANTANAFAVTDPLFELIERHLGGTLADLRKLTPSYPRHIKRRAEEMEALARMLDERALPNHMARAAGATFRALGAGGCWPEGAASEDFMKLLSDVSYHADK